MNQDKHVYSGHLLLPQQGKIVLRKTWNQKFCLLYKMSKFGVDRLEIYDTADEVLKNAIPRIITLENCVKITPQPPNLFTVITKTGQHVFSTLTEKELNEWVTAFQTVAFKDDVSKITHIEEDNDLYCSSGEGVFSVRLSPSEASNRCGLEPKIYTLVLTSSTIQLRNSNDNKILFTWPYCFIRRYGYRSGKFTFEAGRKCDTGEGVFHLEHSNQQEIFRCLSSKMKSMKKILSGESTTNLLDCGDNQFHAALSMEARSRSPLPPSPTSSTRLQDIEGNNSAQSSTKTLVTQESVDKNINYHSGLNTGNSAKPLISFTDKNMNNRHPMPRPKPTKPPRKNLPIKEGNTSDLSKMYEPVSVTPTDPKGKMNYDEIEYRKEAWRTLGVDNINHTESVTNLKEELEEYTSWSILKTQKSQENLKTQSQQDLTHFKSTKIISTNPIKDSDDSYDKLNFFGSSSKLSNHQPGYKQVLPTPIQATAPVMPSWNDYDEVEVNMQAVRLADDSHLGYGVIRKTNNQQKSPEQKVSVPHKLYNDAAYAIVSKPKRV